MFLVLKDDSTCELGFLEVVNQVFFLLTVAMCLGLTVVGGFLGLWVFSSVVVIFSIFVHVQYCGGLASSSNPNKSISDVLALVFLLGNGQSSVVKC